MRTVRALAIATVAAYSDADVEAGLIFVGPPADVIRTLGNKQAARRLAERGGVPVVPGYHGDDQANLADHARALRFPLIVKAAAGGGGKGMRVVHRVDDLA